MARRQARPRTERRPLPWAKMAAVSAVLLIVGGLAWTGYALTDPSLLPVQTVRVGGELKHLSRGALRTAVAPYAEAGLLRVDVTQVRRALEALAWVDRAQVRRVWPDVLEIGIAEQRPIARWDGRALVNHRGELFRPPEAQWPQGLPQLAGPERNAAAIAARFSELRNLFAPLGLELAALIQDKRRSWKLRLTNGIELMLGRDRTAERLLRFMELYPRVLAKRADRIERVDLRYTNGLAVGWAQNAAAGT